MASALKTIVLSLVVSSHGIIVGFLDYAFPLTLYQWNHEGTKGYPVAIEEVHLMWITLGEYASQNLLGDCPLRETLGILLANTTIFP